MRAIVVAVGLAGSLVAGTALWAAGDQPGRYTMNPAEGGGFARLDTQTGQMSLCQRRDGQWACQDMADQGRGLAEEVERLRQENRLLKGDVLRLEEALRAAGAQVPPGIGVPGRRPGVIEGLPSEQDVDQALSYMQRLFRKFREKMKDFENEGKGTPL